MDLNEIRKEINQIDEMIALSFYKRLELVRQVAEYKKQTGMSVTDSKREEEILERLCKGENAEYYRTLFSTIFEASKKYQNEILGETQQN